MPVGFKADVEFLEEYIKLWVKTSGQLHLLPIREIFNYRKVLLNHEKYSGEYYWFDVRFKNRTALYNLMISVEDYNSRSLTIC